MEGLLPSSAAAPSTYSIKKKIKILSEEIVKAEQKSRNVNFVIRSRYDNKSRRFKGKINKTGNFEMFNTAAQALMLLQPDVCYIKK
jgi:hypothetical protein